MGFFVHCTQQVRGIGFERWDPDCTGKECQSRQIRGLLEPGMIKQFGQKSLEVNCKRTAFESIRDPEMFYFVVTTFAWTVATWGRDNLDRLLHQDRPAIMAVNAYAARGNQEQENECDMSGLSDHSLNSVSVNQRWHSWVIVLS
jgi:hypothetical protein